MAVARKGSCRKGAVPRVGKAGDPKPARGSGRGRGGSGRGLGRKRRA